jgi:Holliday junction resolvase-like predicted endonuclease
MAKYDPLREDLARRPAATPPAPTRTPASPAPPGPAGVAATADEAAVQAHLVAYLVGEGWQIVRVADTATRERGIDILARRDGRTLAVEVKGYPGTAYADPRRAGEVKPTQPSTQARHWYAQAVLKAMLTREEQPGYDLALGFPEATTYRRLHRGTRGSLDRLGVTVLFVAADGSVVEG